MAKLLIFDESRILRCKSISNLMHICSDLLIPYRYPENGRSIFAETWAQFYY